jgi:ketosteroid isomerase-like protein
LTAKESTTPDLVERWREAFEAASRRDIDAVMGFHAPDAVWDLSDLGLGTFEGVAAIRAFLEDWFATWQDLALETEELLDLGHGVVFAPVREEDRPTGSAGHVEQRRGWVTLWVQRKIVRAEIYLDVDEACAAAVRLVESRAQADV